MASQKRNLAASVHRRLLSLSHENGEDFNLILVRYGIERILYRLSQSKHADLFLLKGAMLFLIWSGEIHRPTRDVDLLGFGSSDAGELERIFREICLIEVEPDGLLFKAETVKAEEIREQAAYPGIRVTAQATLGTARISIQVDIGFGDAVTPNPEEIQFPTLLDFPAPHLHSYPIYTTVAEKLETMVLLGEANSRMKDFFDVQKMSILFEFDGPTLVQAIRATFNRRKTSLPSRVPEAFTRAFALAKRTQWEAFIRRNALPDESFSGVVESLHEFLYRPLRAASRSEAFAENWNPGGPWSS
jgi:nucleotidyltransferase AbiEii toxin of type IV toxin-antitoxin system